MKKEWIFPGILLVLSLSLAVVCCLLLPDTIHIHLSNTQVSKYVFTAIQLLLSCTGSVLAIRFPEMRTRMLIATILFLIVSIINLIFHMA